MKLKNSVSTYFKISNIFFVLILILDLKYNYNALVVVYALLNVSIRSIMLVLYDKKLSRYFFD